jgi:site-specific DNA-methyltransferase (adenine-specific)
VPFEKVVIGNATLYRADCLEVLPTLPKVDAVITDPPYGIGFRYGSPYMDSAEHYREIISPLKGMPVALLQYPEEMMRLVVPVLGAPDECLAWVYPSNLPRQFRLWGLWDLKANFYEVKQPARNPESSKVKSIEVGSYDWWEQPQVKNVSAEKTEHPCQIPVSCVERVIRLTGSKNVLDPFMGSGTTGVACTNLNRGFIGIEIHKPFFDIACERIENAQRQQKMFA